MAVESDDDRLATLADFGVNIDIAGEVIIAIFDNGYEDALGSWVTTPILTARTMDIEGSARGTTVVIDNVSYTIAEQQPDGQGISTVVLQRT